MKALFPFLFLLLPVLTTLSFASPPSPERQAVSLDIYNRDLAMIRDVRTVSLQKGVQEIDFTGVAEGIFGHTAAVRPLEDEKRVATKSLIYNFDLVTHQKLLQRFVGRWISFQADDATYQGRLLALDEGHIFLQPDTLAPAIQVVERSKLTEMFYPSLPEGVFALPTLRWRVESAKRLDDIAVEVSYLTSDITWMCDYRGDLIGDDSLLLNGSFTISNDLPQQFPGANVALVVGKPHRSSDPGGSSGGDEAALPGSGGGKSAGAGPERLGELYRYTLPDPIDLIERQTIKVPFFAFKQVKVERRYFFPHLLDAQQVAIQLRFEPSAEAFGETPLPEGDIGLYRRRADGGLAFIGEDFIPITPPGGRVELTLGAAPDITARRVRLAQARPTRDSSEETWRVEVVSSRAQAVVVWVEQRVYGYYTLVKAVVDTTAVSPTTEESGRLLFPVTVPAGGKAVLTFALSFGY